MNIGVIGCGYWGPNLIRNFHAIKDCNMAVCCDLDRNKLDRMQGLFPRIKVTCNYKDLLAAKYIDAVGVATPVHTHYDLARECLQADKHILVEKPLATSSRHCIELANFAEKAGKVLMVGHTFEYSAAVEKIKETIQRGELGEILYISTLRLNLGLLQPDINVVWDLAPHDISIILSLLGKDPVSVNGQGKAHYYDNIEDVATATLYFDNGEVAFMHQSWLDPYKVRKMTIVGAKKMLVYDDVHTNEKIKIFDKGVEAPAHYDTFAEFHFSYHYGDIFSPRIEEREPLRAECEHFLECIRDGKSPKSNAYAGLRVVAIIEAINQSMKKNGAATWLQRIGKDFSDNAFLRDSNDNKKIGPEIASH